MNFAVVENIRKHDSWDTLRGFGHGLLKILLVLILIPVLVVSWIIGLFRTKEVQTYSETWRTLYEDQNIRIESWDFDENELPTDLDYPEEPNDIYAQFLRSEPEIKELEGLHFNAMHLKTDDGYYFQTFNEKGQGMSLWLLRTRERDIVKVRDIESRWWSMDETENGLILKAKESKQDVELRIEKLTTTTDIN